MENKYDLFNLNISYFWTLSGYFLTVFLIGMQCVFGSIQLRDVYPNTVDDKNLEYIEVRNTGCETIDLSNYTLEDALPKIYTIPSGTILGSHTNMRFGRPDTKLELNNVNESIRLRDSSGTLISEYAYENSVKGEPISIPGAQDDTCDVSIGTSTESGTLIDSGTLINTGYSDMSSSGVSLENIGDLSGSLVDSGTMLGSPGGLGGSGESIGTGENISIALSGIVFSGELAPISLAYGDIDEDGYIDMLSLEYCEILTGILIPENISLYSQTGGLYLTGVLTQSGYIIGSSLSGKTLILSIRESDIQKSLLRINNTTQSDLRLKSSGNIGLTTIYGQKLASLFLTTSFNNYKNIVHPPSGVDLSSVDLSASGATGSMISSGLTFPDIVPTMQNYTNALFQSGIFLCSEKICRINLNFEPIFSSGWIMSQYTCRIATGSIWLDTCNPPQLYFSQSGIIQFSLREKSTQGERTIEYPVIYLYQDGGISNIVSSLTGTIDQEGPTIIVEMDGKWKEYFEQIGDYELNCYAFTCGVNLTADRSYDSGGGKIKFLWLYDMQNLSESKDPGMRYFTIGDHEIWLRVIDMAGNMSQVRYKIHVYPPKETPQKVEKKKKRETTIKNATSKKSSSPKKKKKPKKLKMDFYDPPEWIVQNSGSFLMSGNTLSCQTKKKYCSINLTIKNPEKDIIYTWIYPDGTEIQSKNPRSFRFTPGQGLVSLVATNTQGLVLSETTFRVNVERIIKEKKKSHKKPKKPKKSGNISSKPSQESIGPPKESTSLYFGDIGFMSSILLSFLLIGGYLGWIFRLQIYRIFSKHE